MPDIFISYSRKDSAHALALAEKLRLEGMDVWIDQHGIGGATLWSQEIAASIAGCGTFLLLISSSSVESPNVLRELLLAMEKGKNILPVMIEEVALPEAFEYPLAGIQRIAIADWDAIVSVLKHPRSMGAHHRALPPKGVLKFPFLLSKQMRYALSGIAFLVAAYLFFVGHKSAVGENHTIAVLPFENASGDSTQNYFAYGLSDELTGALVKIHTLRVTSPERIREYKTASLAPLAAGGELGVDYIVSGSVLRKEGSIKISVHVLDVHSGEIVWSETYEGERRDIFRIEEEVPKEIASALRLALTPSETKQLEKQGTDNADAHDYYLRAIQQFYDPTIESMRTAIYLLREAIQLDPNYAEAFSGLAGAYRMSGDLDSAYLMAVKGFTLDPNSAKANSTLAVMYSDRHQVDDAIRLARKGVALAPNDASTYYALARILAQSDTLPDEAISNVEKSILLDPLHLWHYVFLVSLYSNKPGLTEEYRHTCARAIPVFTLYLSKNPDAIIPRIWLGLFNEYLGNDSAAIQQFSIASESKLLTPHLYVWVASELYVAGAKQKGIDLLKKGIRDFDREEIIAELRMLQPSHDSLALDPEIKKHIGGK